MATHSSTLALKIPWTEELGAGYYLWGHKESGMTERLHFLSFFVYMTRLKSVCLFGGFVIQDISDTHHHTLQS